jgi:hypothetical protein
MLIFLFFLKAIDVSSLSMLKLLLRCSNIILTMPVQFRSRLLLRTSSTETDDFASSYTTTDVSESSATIIHYAVATERVGALQVLIESGKCDALVNVRSHVWQKTPLDMARTDPKLDQIVQLLEPLSHLVCSTIAMTSQFL